MNGQLEEEAKLTDWLIHLMPLNNDIKRVLASYYIIAEENKINNLREVLRNIWKGGRNGK